MSLSLNTLFRKPAFKKIRSQVEICSLSFRMHEDFKVPLKPHCAYRQFDVCHLSFFCFWFFLGKSTTYKPPHTAQDHKTKEKVSMSHKHWFIPNVRDHRSKIRMCFLAHDRTPQSRDLADFQILIFFSFEENKQASEICKLPFCLS